MVYTKTKLVVGYNICVLKENNREMFLENALDFSLIKTI